MLKKVVVLMVLLSSIVIANDTETKKNKPLINDLLVLPFEGGRLINSGDLKIDDQQMKQMMEEVRPIMHGKYNALLQKAFKLEKSIQRSIIKKGKKFDDTLKKKVSELAKLKLEAAEYKIEALVKIRDILTPKQWKIWVAAK